METIEVLRRSDVFHYLEEDELFHYLEEDELKIVANMCTQEVFEAGTIIYASRTGRRNIYM